MQQNDRREGAPHVQSDDLSVTKVRQAVAPHVVRYVLGISLLLAVLGLGVTLALGGI